jgi:hypothetical protein
MNHRKTHHANLHGFYVKGYRPNPTYKVQEMDGLWSSVLSAGETLLQKTVTNAETSLAKSVSSTISNVTGQVQTTAQNIQNAVNPQPSTVTTNIVAQPMSDFQKYGLMLGAGFVGLIGVVALVKALK